MTEPKIKNNELIKARRAQICRAAEELFAQKGYHKTSIRDIANKSGISIGSLYDYIRNKEDILYLLAKEFYDNLRTEVIKVLEAQHNVVSELEGTLATMLRVVDRFQEYTLFTYRDSKYLKREDLIALLEQDSFFTGTFTQIIQKGVRQGIFEALEPEVVANMLTILTHSWALKRYNLKRFSLYLFQKTLIQFVLNGLMKKEGNGRGNSHEEDSDTEDLDVGTL
ncbi:MAG: TetR/AcrR family transcriptional regulator [Desulfobacteraceae bacterium]